MPYFHFHQFNTQLLNFSACASIKINFLLAIYLCIKIYFPLYFLFINVSIYSDGVCRKYFSGNLDSLSYLWFFFHFLNIYLFIVLRFKIFGCEIFKDTGEIGRELRQSNYFRDSWRLMMFLKKQNSQTASQNFHTNSFDVSVTKLQTSSLLSLLNVGYFLWRNPI